MADVKRILMRFSQSSDGTWHRNLWASDSENGGDIDQYEAEGNDVAFDLLMEVLCKVVRANAEKTPVSLIIRGHNIIVRDPNYPVPQCGSQAAQAVNVGMAGARTAMPEASAPAPRKKRTSSKMKPSPRKAAGEKPARKKGT